MPTSIAVAFLFDCSSNMLGEYELARLNRVANIKKQLRALIDEAVEQMGEANSARWMMEHRDELCRKIIEAESHQEVFDFGGS